MAEVPRFGGSQLQPAGHFRGAMNYLRGNVSYSDLRGYMGHYSHSETRATRKKVARHFYLPSNLRGVKSSTVWGVTMVRNEEDIVEDVIRHQVSQGISPILIADNNSMDKTPQILARLAEELPIFVIQDSLDAYHQAEKMTALSRLAFRHGARWVVPFDADEMWFAEGSTVADYLNNSNLCVSNVAMYNVYPGKSGKPAKIDSTKQPMGKVAFRASYFALLGIGNHTVDRSGKRGEGLYIAHFPWRSIEQLRRKVRQGRQALEAASLPANMGSHWRALAVLTDDDVETLWSFIETQTPHPALNDQFTGPIFNADPKVWNSWVWPQSHHQDLGPSDA